MAKMKSIVVPIVTSPEGLSVKEMVKDYLKAHKYDGLYHDGLACSCEWSYLAPCGGFLSHCFPGYKVKCLTCGDNVFYIQAKKP